MMNKKGYSMVVLVIAITVILILATSTISVLQISREKTSITNFIYDITTVEEMVQDFYVRTGTLPTKAYKKINIEELNNQAVGIISQLDPYDNENYYFIDLSQLGNISLKDSEREYIVNEGSLKIYVKNGTEYSNFDTNGTRMIYYTLTSNLVNGLEPYVSQNEEVLVIGNPTNWVSQANLRVVLPKRDLKPEGENSWDKWKFKWDYGPKSIVELSAISDSDLEKNFKYGDTLIAKSNGIYSIYIKNPLGRENLINVNVNKVDDIKPTFRFLNKDGKVQIEVLDNETGIKKVNYKTLANYNKNYEQAQIDNPGELEGRTEIDYYLMDGEGKDLIYTLPAEIEMYIKNREIINKALQDEYQRYDKWLVENDLSLLTPEEIKKEQQKHEDTTKDLQNQLETLNKTYPYLKDIYGKSDDSKLVLYIEDEAGNAVVAGIENLLSTEILSDSYNISTNGL